MEPVWIGPTAAELLDRDRRWSVSSIFDSSANLRLEPDGQMRTTALLHIGSGRARAPFGIDVTERDWGPWRRRLDKGLVEGDWDADSGRISGNPPLILGAGWRTHAGEATIPAGDLQADWFPEPSAAVYASGILRGIGPGAVLGRVRSAIADIIEGKIDGTDWLLGRGPGVTPSGDDIVIGMLAVLNRSGMPGNSDEGVRTLTDRLARSGSSQTTEVSIAYLSDAVRGRFAEPLRQLLLATDRDDAAAQLAALRVYGHTSGADTILGVTAAIEAVHR